MQEASAKQGAAALQALQQLAPRQVFEELFAVEAYNSLRSAAAAARQADDNSVLLSGLREVEGLTSSALNQLPLTRHQLTKLCQVSPCLQTSHNHTQILDGWASV